MKISSDTGAHLEFCIQMEKLASQPYSNFIFDNSHDADAFQRFLAERDLAESSPPFGRLMLDDGVPVALVTGCGGKSLRDLRLRSAFALAKAKFFSPGSPYPARIRLASQTLIVPNDDDFYSGRLGVHASRRNSGLGLELMDVICKEAAALGFRRVVGEVDPRVKNMLRLCCDTLGFEEMDRRRVEDASTGRFLEYVHISKLF